MFNFLQCGLADAPMKLKGGRIYAMMTINILKFLAANAHGDSEPLSLAALDVRSLKCLYLRWRAAGGFKP